MSTAAAPSTACAVTAAAAHAKGEHASLEAEARLKEKEDDLRAAEEQLDASDEVAKIEVAAAKGEVEDVESLCRSLKGQLDTALEAGKLATSLASLLSSQLKGKGVDLWAAEQQRDAAESLREAEQERRAADRKWVAAKGELDDLKAVNTGLESRVAEAAVDLQAAEQQRDAAKGEVDDLKAVNTGLERRADASLKAEARATRAAAVFSSQLKEKAESLREAEQERRAADRKRVAAKGEVDETKVLLTSLESRLSEVQDASNNQIGGLRALNDSLGSRLVEVEEAAKNETDELRALNDSLETELAELQSALSGKIDDLQTQNAKLQTQVDELEAAAKVETVDLTGETQEPPLKRQRLDGDSAGRGGGAAAAPASSALSRLAALNTETHAATIIKVEVARDEAAAAAREDAEDGMACVSCMERPRDVVFTDCSHMAVCELCIPMCQGLCPICRVAIGGVVKGVKMP